MNETMVVLPADSDVKDGAEEASVDKVQDTDKVVDATVDEPADGDVEKKALEASANADADGRGKDSKGEVKEAVNVNTNKEEENDSKEEEKEEEKLIILVRVSTCIPWPTP